jgi:hypothetical protein
MGFNDRCPFLVSLSIVGSRRVRNRSNRSQLMHTFFLSWNANYGMFSILIFIFLCCGSNFTDAFVCHAVLQVLYLAIKFVPI